MTVTIFMFIPRKPGMSLAAFRDHYENKHIPLVMRACGDAQPLRHTRFFLKRAAASEEGGASQDAGPPLLFAGNPDTIDYDCIAKLDFEDEAHLKRFQQMFKDSPLKPEMEADAEKFADTAKFKIVAVEDGLVIER